MAAKPVHERAVTGCELYQVSGALYTQARVDVDTIRLLNLGVTNSAQTHTNATQNGMDVLTQQNLLRLSR